AVREMPGGPFLRCPGPGVHRHPPRQAPKTAQRVEERTVYLIFRAGRVALRRRPDKGLLSGLWEYPNALAGESGALEAWGIAPASLEWGGEGKHIFTHIEWRMTGRVVRAASSALPQGWVWADREELGRAYAVPSAFRPFEALV